MLAFIVIIGSNIPITDSKMGLELYTFLMLGHFPEINVRIISSEPTLLCIYSVWMQYCYMYPCVCTSSLREKLYKGDKHMQEPSLIFLFLQIILLRGHILVKKAL